MSLEPPTTAKVVLHAAKRQLQIELWAKEVPETSRRFIQNCLDKKYVGQSFDRVVRDFLVQTNSLVPSAFDLRVEKFPRLKFNKRGLLGAVASGAGGSTVDSFFITCREASELNAAHTVFGKIVGDSYYTVVTIHDGELQESSESPLHPVQITDCEVLVKYFDDLVPTPKQPESSQKGEAEPPKKKKKTKVKLDLDFEDDIEDVSGGFKMKTAFESKQPPARAATQEAAESGDVAGVSEPPVDQSAFQEREAKSAKPQASDTKSVPKPSLAQTPHVGPPRGSQTLPQGSLPSRPKPPHARIPRDPSVDSDYDPYLDLLSEEESDPQLTLKHVFGT